MLIGIVEKPSRCGAKPRTAAITMIRTSGSDGSRASASTPARMTTVGQRKVTGSSAIRANSSAPTGPRKKKATLVGSIARTRV